MLICCSSVVFVSSTHNKRWFLKSLHRKFSLVSGPCVHCSTQTLKTWRCRRHAFPPELHVFLLNHTNETHSHVWKKEANSGNHDCGCLATIRPRSHSNRPISHRNRLWVIMSNQAVQRRTTKGGMGERGGRGGRTERMGDEEKEEERENQDGRSKKTRQETWTMRRKSRGSPSGRYRSAQKRLIKSFREVKRKKKKMALAGRTLSVPPYIRQI